MSRITIAGPSNSELDSEMRAESKSPPRSVAFAVPDFDPSVGGTSRQVGLLARELARRGHPVRVITRRRRGLPRAEQSSGIDVRRVGRPSYGRVAEKLAVVELATVLRPLRPTALVTVQWSDAVLAASAAGLLSRTVVVWAAAGDATDAVGSKLGLGRLRRRAFAATRHIVLTEAMAAELEHLGLPEPAVVPVPVDGGHFRPPSSEERAAARAALAVQDAFVILYVGHLRALKGVDSLIDAFAALGRDTSARLVLVGGSRGATDDVEPALRSQVERLGLSDEVVFAGVLRDPRSAYWAADAFVLPSTREGMPNTLVEALACGVPCIAPASAGGDAVLANGAGVITSSNGAAELARALHDLADDDTRRNQLARAGLDRVAELDVRTVADAYEQILAKLPR